MSISLKWLFISSFIASDNTIITKKDANYLCSNTKFAWIINSHAITTCQIPHKDAVLQVIYLLCYQTNGLQFREICFQLPNSNNVILSGLKACLYGG